MKTDPKGRRWVRLDQFGELLRAPDAERGAQTPPMPPVRGADAEKVRTVTDPPVVGLPQLGAMTWTDADVASTDFAKYRVGFNNRALLSPIVADLNARFGTKISYRYAPVLEAFGPPHKSGVGFADSTNMAIGEKAIDKLVEPFEAPRDRQAIATFAVAHEFFHALLKHAHLLDFGSSPKGYRIAWGDKYRQMFELQVDYLAARYLKSLGLPLDAVITMFETGDFEPSEDYPSGEVRADNVRIAFDEAFRLELFDNDVVACLDFLDTIAMNRD
ncbi:MAG: hypothetical protein RKU31_41360 [Deltaproteobacteria bacterium]|jgi:hypothetical protein